MLGLVALLLLAAIAQTQNKTYTVRDGDTLSGIASKVGVGQAAIAKANKLTTIHKIKPGMTLRIPAASRAAAKSFSAPKGSYIVRDGDNDWIIAKRLNVTVAQLHSANPGIHWSKIRAGHPVAVPSASLKAQIAAKYAKRKPSGGYLVKSGDNDWSIAKRYSITPSQLRAMNPGVNWRAIQLGQRINVPGSKVVIAAPTDIRSRFAVITADDVTVRSGPDVSHQSIVTVKRSRTVTVLDREAGWYKVKFEYGTIGWVRGDFLKAVSATRVAAAKIKQSQKYVASNYSRRSSRFSRRYAPVSKGEILAVDTTGENADVLAKARSLLGTPYVWAHASSRGTDCSGFTTQVYNSVGVRLPRTSRDQSQVGMPIPRESLKKGDLMFFRTRGGGRTIGHVGIYIGNNKFIHSSSGAGRVTIDEFKGYYSRRFAGARRVKGGSSSHYATRSSKKNVGRVVAAKSPAKDEQDAAAPKVEAAPPQSTRGVDEIGK